MDSTLEKLSSTGFSGLDTAISALDASHLCIVSDSVDTVTFFAEYKEINRVSLENIGSIGAQLLLVELSAKFCSDEVNLTGVPELLKGKKHITVMYVDGVAAQGKHIRLDKSLEVLTSSEPVLGLLNVADTTKGVLISTVPKDNKGNVFVGPFSAVAITTDEDKAADGKIGYFGDLPISLRFKCPQFMLDVFSGWYKNAKDYSVSTFYLETERGDEPDDWFQEAFTGQGKYDVAHIHDMTFSDSLTSLNLQGHTIENLTITKTEDKTFDCDSVPPIQFDMVPPGLKSGDLFALPRAVLKDITLPPKSIFLIKFNISFPKVENLVAPDSTIVFDTGAVFTRDMRVFGASTRNTDYQFLKQATTLVINSIAALEVLLHVPRDTFINLKKLRIDFLDKIDCQEPWDIWESKSLLFPCLEELFVSMPRDIVEKVPKWKLPSLKKLHLEDNAWSYINKATLANIASKLPQLEELELKCSSWPDHDGIDTGDFSEFDDTDRSGSDDFEDSDGYDSDGANFDDMGNNYDVSDSDYEMSDEEDGVSSRKQDLYGYRYGAFENPNKSFKYLKKLVLTNIKGHPWTKLSFPSLNILECNGIDIEKFNADAPKLTELTLSSSGFREPVTIEGPFPQLKKVQTNDFGTVSIGTECNQLAVVTKGKRRSSFGLDWDL